jgi:hypothetical protein
MLGDNICKVHRLQPRSPIVVKLKQQVKIVTFGVSMGRKKNGAYFKKILIPIVLLEKTHLSIRKNILMLSL